MPITRLSEKQVQLSTMFGKRNRTITTYSKNRPVQITTKNHFLTPDTPEDSWIPSSKEKSSKQDAIPPIIKKGSKSWVTPLGGRGSSLALRNISNIPLEKTLNRTPCVPSRRPHQTNRKLISGGILLSKVSSSEGKECKTYRNELQRANLRSKKGSSIKSKVLVSTTTYSSRSMSCCSMCDGEVCSNENSLSTIKSMSLCKSCHDHGISDDLRYGEHLSNMPQVSQPHNSTLVEEDLRIELKDIIPQDLSAIMEEPIGGEEHIEPFKKSKKDHTDVYELYDEEEVVDSPCPPKCSTPVDPGKIQALDSASPGFSPIAVPNKTCVPAEVKLKTRIQELGTNDEDVPNITPEIASKKECVATDEPKQKRKLAYSMDMDKLPDCILLHAKNNRKRPFNLLFKHDKSSQSCSNTWSNLPIDFLVQSP